MTEATRWASRWARAGNGSPPLTRDESSEESSEETPDSSVPDTKSPQTNDLKERREACDRWRSRLKPEQVVHLRDLLIKKDKEIARRDEEIETLKKNMICLSTLFSKDIETTHKEIDCLKEDLDITEGELKIFQTSEKEWIGRALQLKFILDEIKKIEALPKDHAEWVDPMVEQVEFPEVSINVKDEFIPTDQTDNIDWVDDEEYDDEEYDEEDEEEEDEEEEDGHDLIHCTNCGEINDHLACDCPLSQGIMSRMFPPWCDEAGGSEASAGGIAHYPHPRAIREKSAKTIQRYWRGYRTRVVLPRIAMQDSEDKQDLMRSAKTIQRYWRGHSMRVLLKIRNLVVSQSLSQLYLLAIGERGQ